MNEKLEARNQEIDKPDKKLRRARDEKKILEHHIKT